MITTINHSAAHRSSKHGLPGQALPKRQGRKQYEQLERQPGDAWTQKHANEDETRIQRPLDGQIKSGTTENDKDADPTDAKGEREVSEHRAATFLLNPDEVRLKDSRRLIYLQRRLRRCHHLVDMAQMRLRNKNMAFDQFRGFVHDWLDGGWTDRKTMP